ncbi:uncharacterized protein N7469_005441 [Penicillium citrinum]|uniref:UBX domain-containing protein 2 n=1 Tax=Penicillium citrinum TaxID=5077 RepID=A0A9W9P1N4_PENCI|nr:uncharacterized protein N7469_005441 [Penicillium citrinum]KAJ5233675.1 hypothetical protein N7469_005441 [Penicillium citrinum]
MALFYSGTLQEGIALAVNEAKAVVCFARDDAELSSTWEEDYFADSEIVQALCDKAITLRLAAGSQEAGFLTSFCPISSYPTVIVIKNGTLQEFITSEVSKGDFLNRLKVALEGKYVAPTSQQPQASASSANDTTTTSSTSPTSPPAPSTQQPTPQVPAVSSHPEPRQMTEESSSSTPLPSKKAKTEKPKENQDKPPKSTNPPLSSAKPVVPKTTKKTKEQLKEEPKPQPPVPRGPPKEYRLQVRLFDGSSVRSTFLPNQTIGKDVRSWLDQQLTDDHRPYNLKHILTPLPSQTLSASDESQTLEKLCLGSTANLVMVPVQSYTSAYAASASSLPVRGISTVYGVASSVASTATSFIGSFLGYGQTETPSEPEASSSTPVPTPRNTRSSGPRIRTLHDQRNDGRDSQLYNGNQLNFEPRNQDGSDR